jgi:hypothetical protein
VSDRVLDRLREVLGSGSDEERLEAVQSIEPKCKILAQADAFLWAVVWRLLRSGRLLEVAQLIWTEELFDARPEVVKKIWNKIESSPKVIFLGCGSAGKSYSSIAWFLLDWLRDPQFTNCKVMSSTAGHAKSQIFSTLHNLHSVSRIKLPGIRLDGFLGLDSQNRHAGISRVSIPAGASGRGALQGFHPIPRTNPDPIFGRVGRVRALIDEAEEVPVGLWIGISNMLLSMDGKDLIKIVAACNPRDVLSPLAAYAQPSFGWNRLQVDRDKEWTSKEGWDVMRIDGADLENVREKETIYPGFMTFSGYENLRLKDGGNSIIYWTMARGMYPLEGSADTVIPLSWLDDIVGSLLFVSRVVPVAGLDVAFEGDDEVILCAGRYGLAAGWREPRGTLHYFDKQRFCLQVDQFFALRKMRSIELAEQTIELCQKLGIQPEWFLCDRTGNGTGVHDAMISLWDPDVAGQNWGEDATDKKILEDDTTLAIEEYEGIHTEMYWALRRWIEHGYIRFSPTLETERLFKEMTLRRYKQVGQGPTGLGRIRLQPKKEFKAKNGWSPDRADAMVMCLHRVRMLGPERARATSQSVRRRATGRVGTIERTKFVQWSAELDS